MNNLTIHGKNKGGRPKGRSMNDTRLAKQRREELKFGTYVDDINTEIASLRKAVADAPNGKVHAGIINASKAIIHARLALINKCVPDLRSQEITGQVDVDHTVKAEPNVVELAHRVNLYHQKHSPAIEEITGQPLSTTDMINAMLNRSPEERAKNLVHDIVDAEIVEDTGTDPYPFL